MMQRRIPDRVDPPTAVRAASGFPPTPVARARSVVFCSEEEFCPELCYQGCQILGLPMKNNLPPTPHNVNLETNHELYIHSFTIHWYSQKRAHYLLRAQHTCLIFIVIKGDVSKSPKLASE